MALVDDILSFFRSNYKPGPGQFLRFDQQRLVDNLRLREIGRERGAKEQPASDSVDLDVIEQNITEGMRQQALIDEARTQEELDHYAERLKSANPAGEAAAMVMEAQSAVAGFNKAMLSARAILEEARKSVIEREKQLADFKHENGLKRPPNPPRPHWVMSLLLAIYFLGEVFINSSILKSESDLGWLGGIISASIYTFINMALAFILGVFAITHLNHVRTNMKVAGLIGSLVLLGLIVFFNLLAAHYRIAITEGLPELEAAARATQTIFSTTLDFLDDTQSILMVGLSGLVAFFTALKGYYWQDPYPGYAEVNRYKLRAHARWVGSLEDHADELDGIHAHHTKQIRALQTRLSDRQMAIPQILHSRRRLVMSFNNHILHIQDVGRFLMTNYREANMETRKTQRPKYFNRAWKLDTVMPMELPPETESGASNAWVDVGEKLLEASNELNKAHDEVVSWIRELGSSDSAAHADAKQAQAVRAAGSSESKPTRPTLTVVEGANDAQA